MRMQPTLFRREVLGTLLLPMVLLGLLALGACASSGEGAPPRSEEAIGSLYRSRCGSCHEAYAPGAYSQDTWRAMVARYGPRAGLHGTQREEVLAYLLARAR